MGGFINAHTAREETAYYINLLPEHLEMGFDILSDILLNSILPAEEIERERGVIIQEIGQSIDAPDDHVFECFSRSCYGKHTLGNSILGTIQICSRLPRKNIQLKRKMKWRLPWNGSLRERG